MSTVADRTPPASLVEIVERYVESEQRDFKRYEHRGPFDATGVSDLHSLAATIYAIGYEDGGQYERRRSTYDRMRQEAAAKLANGDRPTDQPKED